jgi:hypothetical protein
VMIPLSEQAAARVSAAAAARGVTETEIVEELVEYLNPAPLVLPADEDPLEAFFGCADSGDAEWAGTDTRLLRNPTR